METNDWETGEITLSVNGAPLKLTLTVPSKPVKPQVMLPIFQQMANAFTDIGEKEVEKAQKKISCQKGCGACCRQPVPLAEIEIYHITQLVDQLPEPRQAVIKKRFEEASAHFHQNGWFDAFQQCEQEEELKKLVREYFNEGIACPFLEEESCSIHPHRPIVCREYLVTSPSVHCANPSEENIDQMSLPLNVSNGLRHVGQSGKLSKKNFIPMVFALEWAKQNPEQFEIKTGEEWLGEFFSA